MMFSDEIRLLPLEKAFPADDKSLAIALDKDVSIILTNIQNDVGEYFSIKDVMSSTEGKKIFGERDFNDRVMEFVEILNTRFERFFDTEKTDYIFFDKEEQKYILDIFNKNHLTAIVSLRMLIDGKYEIVDFEKMEPVTFNKFRRYFRQYKLKYIINPERYFEFIMMKRGKSDDFRNKFESRRVEMEKKQIQKYLEKYPELVDINSPEEVKKIMKQYAKKYHPDVNPNGADLFQEMKSDFEKIEETHWYKNLGKKKHETKVPKKKETVKVKQPKSFLDKMMHSMVFGDD